MHQTSRVYVAGHRGMVGSAILRRLQAEGFTNIITATSAQLDLRNQQQTAEFFATHKPEYVFLAAAKVGGIMANNTYKADFIYDNIMIAANVIEQAYRNTCTKLVNLGSSCIYPKFAAQPLTEDSLLTGALEPTNEPYAIAKIAAIKLCRYYNEQHGTDYLSLMPTNLYGPNDNYNLDTSHVLPALVRKIVLAGYLNQGNFDAIRNDITTYNLGFGITASAATTNADIIQLLERFGITQTQVILWGTGNVYREFLHADDVADAALHFMRNIPANTAGEIVNIGTGTDITIRQLAELIAQLVGYNGTLQFDTTKPDGTPRKLMDVQRATRLGWQARISLESGLRSIIEEYLNKK
ncbi:MAG: GDP-L-fucose synthase [Bacteriodetes bacterium]|nr:GDP-L-fucose synthase [Bacteroidota bacterium]